MAKHTVNTTYIIDDQENNTYHFKNNGKAVLAAVNEVLIDKVFSSTVNLSARGVVDFIEQLIAVSEAEIAGDTKKGISGVCFFHIQRFSRSR